MVIVIGMLLIGLSGCSNWRAKQAGGSMTINLPKNTKLITATWKDADLWYLTREMRVGETPEQFTLKEESNLGLVSGTVIFAESK